MAIERMPQLSGLDEELSGAIEERVSEFELKHESQVLQDGSGWVPRIREIDYVIAISINVALTIWLIIAFIWD
jgi:hypothetical protein